MLVIVHPKICTVVLLENGNEMLPCDQCLSICGIFYKKQIDEVYYEGYVFVQ